MAQSLSLLYVHIVFHTHNRFEQIRSTDLNELYSYMGGILKNQQCPPVCIGGMPDHIHILCVLSKIRTVADLVREIKRSSTSWLKSRHLHYKNFQWQKGYGAFSVGVSGYEKTVRYINNQSIHHKKITFKDEYMMFLKESGIEYNEVYLWED